MSKSSNRKTLPYWEAAGDFKVPAMNVLAELLSDLSGMQSIEILDMEIYRIAEYVDKYGIAPLEDMAALQLEHVGYTDELRLDDWQVMDISYLYMMLGLFHVMESKK